MAHKVTDGAAAGGGVSMGLDGMPRVVRSVLAIGGVMVIYVFYGYIQVGRCVSTGAR